MVGFFFISIRLARDVLQYSILHRREPRHHRSSSSPLDPGTEGLTKQLPKTLGSIYGPRADSETPLYDIYLRLPLPTIELVPLINAIQGLSILKRINQPHVRCSGISFSMWEACRSTPNGGPYSLRAKADWLNTIGDHASHIKMYSPFSSHSNYRHGLFSTASIPLACKEGSRIIRGDSPSAKLVNATPYSL